MELQSLHRAERNEYTFNHIHFYLAYVRREEELFQNFWQTLRLQSSSRQPIHIITNQEERGRKNHNGLSTNITRSSFCGGRKGKEEEEEEMAV